MESTNSMSETKMIQPKPIESNVSLFQVNPVTAIHDMMRSRCGTVMITDADIPCGHSMGTMYESGSMVKWG